ncbi:MAG: acetyl-CoA C-acyltransferase [Deltaproteobacteria bacterium]|nr:acetyl-CoA C-acyltransferase [Deltaproteobacteria bacterium]
MGEAYIVGAARSPLGRRKGELAGMHPVDLLGAVQKGLLDRVDVEQSDVDQVIGGCVSQIGEQSFNVARTAWLGAGLPIEVPATTIDSQCGSSQQASTLASGLVSSGLEDLVVSCGVECMTRVPLGSNSKHQGRPISEHYLEVIGGFSSQFDGAEMIAQDWDITRDDTDAFGLRSQELARKAWDAGNFEQEVIPIQAPVLDDEGNATDEMRIVTRDGGLRDTSLEGLGNLKPVIEGGVHTAGTSSQVTDGASAVMLASEAAVKRLNLKPRARIVYSTIVGCDPIKVLEGPIPATEKLLARTGLSIDQIDTFEVNEAFASIVLSWQKASGADPARVNPNGGAIALGHPTGATGDRLITTALHTLERTGGRYGLIAMCCGGGLGTGTIIERLD